MKHHHLYSISCSGTTASFRLFAAICAFLSATLHAQTNIPGTPAENPPQEGPNLGEFIGSIAEKDEREAVDYEQIAQMTLQLGQAAMQQQQRIPDESIWDGIHAVDAGEAIDSLQTDWETLRTELEKLLEKPPEDQQQQQDDQQSDEQNQEDQENSENQNQEGESGDQNSEQSESEGSEEQDQEQNQDQQDGEDQDSQEQQNQNGDQENQSQDSQEGQDSENQQPQNQQNLGDMDTPEETPELDKEREPKKEEQTQVGGTQNQKPIRSAKQAMTLQQLEQIKQQDKPGALHMLLQQAEQDEDAPAPKPLQKDW